MTEENTTPVEETTPVADMHAEISALADTISAEGGGDETPTSDTLAPSPAPSPAAEPEEELDALDGEDEEELDAYDEEGDDTELSGEQDEVQELSHDIEDIYRAVELGLSREKVIGMTSDTLKEVLDVMEEGRGDGTISSTKPAASKPTERAEVPEWEPVSFVSDELKEEYGDDNPMISVLGSIEAKFNEQGAAGVKALQDNAELRQQVSDERTLRYIDEADRYFAEHESFYDKGSAATVKGLGLERRSKVFDAMEETRRITEAAGLSLTQHQIMERAEQQVFPNRAKKAKVEKRNRKVRGRRTATPTNRGGQGRGREETQRPATKQELKNELYDLVEDTVPGFDD